MTRSSVIIGQIARFSFHFAAIFLSNRTLRRFMYHGAPITREDGQAPSAIKRGTASPVLHAALGGATVSPIIITRTCICSRVNSRVTQIERHFAVNHLRSS